MRPAQQKQPARNANDWRAWRWWCWRWSRRTCRPRSASGA